jgi:hypothetical protein
MKRELIWIAVAAVAIPLALSVINAQAQQADDPPRLGETRREYERRLGNAAQHLEEAAKTHRDIAKDLDRDLKQQRTRERRIRSSECDRLSQRAAYGWNQRANERYLDRCTD